MVESIISLEKKIKALEFSIQYLRSSEEKYRQIWEYAPDAIFLTKIGGEDSGTILDANPAASIHTGYPIEELIGMNIVTALPADNEAKALVNMRENDLKQGNHVLFSEKKRRKDGSEYWAEVHIRFIQVGDENVALSINRDVSLPKAAEKALKESEAKFRSIFENKGTVTGLFGENGIVKDCNKVFVDMIGYSKSEIINKMKWSDFVVKEDLERLQKYHSKRMRNVDTPPAKYECNIINKNGEIINVIVNIGVVGEDRIVSLTDITDRKHAENEILKLKEGLEIQVADKTKELKERISELERFNNVMIDRELRMKELHDENEELKAELKKKSGKF